MCGPFVLIATASDGSKDSGSKSLPLACYHACRLTTYLVLGLLIGSIAAAGEGLAGRWHISHAASILVGSTLLVLGLVRLWRVVNPLRAMNVSHSKFFSFWQSMIVKVRQRIRTKNRSANAYVWGVLSTWLPCGWLYVFALASATAGSLVASMMTMAAFWLGTLPSLSVIAWGGAWFRKMNPLAMQWFAAVLMISFGLWTVTARASIDLTRLLPDRHHLDLGAQKLDLGTIRDLQETELPCCSEDTVSADVGEAVDKVQ